MRSNARVNHGKFLDFPVTKELSAGEIGEHTSYLVDLL
jgi:hypothetical protein